MSETEDCAAKAYKRYETERQPYLEEAYRSAQLTIPSLIPDMNDISLRSIPPKLAKPFQSLGAEGVNNLSSKLLLSLFPPTAPFLKYVISDKIKAEAEAAGRKVSEIQSKLARREKRIQDEVDVQNIRSKVFQLLRHLLVAGNVMARHDDDDDGGLQVYPLNAYVCKRDGKGTLLDLIYVDRIARSSAPQAVLEHLQLNPQTDPYSADESKKNSPILLYTRVQRMTDGSYESYQEIGGVELADSRKTHSKKNFRWLILRFTAIDGEDYGRGYVEEYRGNLTSFEQLSRDAQFASANAAKVVWGIKPESQLKPKRFLEADNGTAVVADPEDVAAFRLDKGGDMQVAIVQLERLERALSRAFLLNSSIQRDQERVTAEEIRRLAQELDDSLGGVFSLLSQELQLPLARMIEHDLENNDSDFQKLPDNAVRIGVVTGLAAIGRGQELNRLQEGLDLLRRAAEVMPGIVDNVDDGEFNSRIWTGVGVDSENLVLEKAKVDELRAARTQQNTAQIVGTEAAKGASKSLGNIPPEQMLQMAQQAMGSQQAA